MQKIKLVVFNKMIAEHLTKYEVLFLLTIARYQDNSGLVQGVYYKDICTELGRVSGKERISYQEYYNIVESLEKKGLIYVEKGFKDRNIRILENDFSSQESYQEGYISVNHSIFHLKEFGEMKANEMLLCIDFIKNCEAGNRKSICIGVEKFYTKYTKMLSVKKRVLQGYLTNIRRFFSVGIKDKLYYIEILKKTSHRLPSSVDGSMYRKNIGKMIMRRLRIEYNNEQFNQVTNLMYQYGAKVKDAITQIFIHAVHKSLETINRDIKDPYKWDRAIRPKLIHKLIKEAIASYEVIG